MTIYLKFLLAFLLSYFFSPCSFFTSLLCSIFQDGIKFFRQKSHKGYFISDVGGRQFISSNIRAKVSAGYYSGYKYQADNLRGLQCRNRRKPSLHVSVIKAEHTPVCLKCSSHCIQPPHFLSVSSSVHTHVVLLPSLLNCVCFSEIEGRRNSACSFPFPQNLCP